MGDSAAALSAIPVAVAGWYLGLWGGLASGAVGIFVNALLFMAYNEDSIWHAFPPGAISLLLVGGLAGFLHKIWENRNMVEEELRARERFLTKLSALASEIITASDANNFIRQELPVKIADLFEADDCYLARWDASIGQTVPISAPTREQQPHEPVRYEAGQVNLSDAALTSGYSIEVENVQDSPYVNQQSLAQWPIHSLLGIPLSVGERKLAAAVLAYRLPRKFTPQELRQADQAGKELALVLWELQQDVELQRRLRESSALAEIGRALSATEQVGLDRVLQLIADSAQELVQEAEQVVIHLLDDEGKFLIPRAVAGIDKPEAGTMNMRLGEGVAGQVMAEGIAVNIADVESDPRFLRQEAPPRFRSLMVAPVRSGGKRSGTISIQSAKSHSFSSEDLKLLEGLGLQAALAIENTHLLESTQQSLKEANALYRITQGLVASLDTEHLMKEVVELLQENFGFYEVQIFVIDPASDELIMQCGYGKSGDLLNGLRMPAGQGIVGYAAETGKPFFTNDVGEIVFYVHHPLLPDTQGEMAVPIKVNRRVVGVLDVQTVLPMRLTDRDLQLVSAVADQLAVALQKASLYSDLQTSLAQEKSMRSQLIQSERLALVGRLLASVSHELNNPLQAIQNALFLLQEEKGISPQGRQDLQIVLSETERMAGLIDRLRASYRPTRVEDLHPVNINMVVEDVHTLMATHMRHNMIAFEFHPEPNLPPIAGLHDQIRQVILNLLMNGVEAMPEGGRLTVSTELCPNREVLLSISDTGPGIDPVFLPHIFDAFVTSKDRGTGLGLTITYDIITRHNGRIAADNNPERGATFKIWLPIHSQETFA
jgi:signal transduction histidine kinase